MTKGILDCDGLSYINDTTFLQSIIWKERGYARNTC